MIFFFFGLTCFSEKGQQSQSRNNHSNFLLSFIHYPCIHCIHSFVHLFYVCDSVKRQYGGYKDKSDCICVTSYHGTSERQTRGLSKMLFCCCCFLLFLVLSYSCSIDVPSKMITTSHMSWFKFTLIKFKISFPQTTGHISSDQ